MTDGVVTHAEVLRWLPEHVRRGLEMSMPPEQRGWFSEAEMQQYDGRFVEVQSMSEPEPRYYATGGIVRLAYRPSLAGCVSPTSAELTAGTK